MSPLPGAGRIEQLAQAVAERVVALVLEAIDLDALLDRIDVERLMDRIDVNAVVSKVDVDALVSRVDVEALIERVDVQGIVSRVDVDELISRVDVERMIDRVNVQSIIDRVDVQQLVERVDLEAVVQRVDIEAIVSQTEIGTIIAHSTSGVASEVLDVVRAQGVGLDDFVARWVNRVMRRSADDLPLGPPALVGGPGPVPALSAAGGSGDNGHAAKGSPADGPTTADGRGGRAE
jgi:hypothetical protein